MSEAEVDVHSAALIWAAAGFWQGRHSVGLRLLSGGTLRSASTFSKSQLRSSPPLCKGFAGRDKICDFQYTGNHGRFSKGDWHGTTCGKNRQPGAERMGRNEKKGRWAKGK